MADFIVEKVIESIGKVVVKEVLDMWGYKSQLEELKQTVTTIRKVLLDAEAKPELSYETQDYIARLKDAVYDADDLFDELVTVAELNQLLPLTKRGKFYEKVRCFFSSKNQLGQAYRMFRDVKDLTKKLGNIADNHHKFGLGVDCRAIIGSRETCSAADVHRLVGRENDKEAIIDVLLNHNDEELFVATIVGAGGLGKTTLAQFVYNDDRIKEFFDLRLWVCVSDENGVPFDVKTILCKILQLAGHQIFDVNNFTKELLQQRFQESLRGKKYLLVLDDVWNEDRVKWLELEKFLKLGQAGSKVVVTTRSEGTGLAVGEKHKLRLQVLSPDNSWLLFEMFAFQKDKPENYHEFVETGKRIVAKCCNNPLAIKVMGSLLRSQGISKWRSLEAIELAKIDCGDIKSILKLSYYNLTPSLKNCFSYCALFHKDEHIEKQMLIDLWIAQGYIIPLDENQDIEDVAEEHFLILLRRCFFEDVKKGYFGNVYHNFECVKIHDLIYDVALAGREEIGVRTCNTMNLGETMRHVRYDISRGDVFEFPLGSRKMRSFIFLRQYMFLPNDVKEYVLHGRQMESWMRLRVLGMCEFRVKKLPKSIGELLHLRYLDLSRNEYLEVLPDAITSLHNLQTLLLNRCSKLRELPEDFCKLVNLRQLDLEDCIAFTSMPRGMEKLTKLKVLTYYVAGRTNNKRAVKGADNSLESLKSLAGIRGKMNIVIGENYNGGVGGEYLKRMEYLTEVEIQFEGRCNSNQEGVLENLQPHSNVKVLRIIGYDGTRIPKWGRAVDDNYWPFCLSHLVKISLLSCVNLEEVPVLSKLPLLKLLYLSDLEKLEYMEMEIKSGEDALFFPSLESLWLLGLKKLKGWWKEESSGDLTFPCLSDLWIDGCTNLTSFPPCPAIEELIWKRGREIRWQINQSDDNTVGSSVGNNGKKLWDLCIDNITHLKSLPIHWITRLSVQANEEVEGLSQEELETCDFPPNLRSLTLQNLKEMKSLPAGMQCLTSLQTLEIRFNEKLETLPEWISCLSSLNSLFINGCPALKSLPEAMTKLTSLQRLSISFSPKVAERCKESDGEDRPKIQHIPNIQIP